jgi:hypothetical protein
MRERGPFGRDIEPLGFYSALASLPRAFEASPCRLAGLVELAGQEAGIGQA